jgi:AbiJ N-terminal domain 4
MLTDIFTHRYSNTPIWNAVTPTESRLLVQAFRLVEERVMPFRRDGRDIYEAKEKWTSVHDALSMELGLQELSPRSNGWNAIPMDVVCKAFVTEDPSRGVNADAFVKERLSFIELAFRMREEELAAYAAGLPQRIRDAKRRHAERAAALSKIGKPVIEQPDAIVAGLTAEADDANSAFRSLVAELNERFRRAGTRLNYHNGYIQLGGDEVTEREVERPFWSLVAAPKWRNVDIDMKEAFDRRDGGDRDPALYAAKALESTIKIISDDKGWTHGGEKGAHSYIDNLGAEKNGRFVTPWERDALKAFFTFVRNPLGHGPGNEAMPELTAQQTDWAIETCMSWIKALIGRL